MKTRLSLLDYLTLAVFGVQAAFALHIAFHGPAAPIPLHWNAALQVDRWGDAREFAWVFAGITFAGLMVTGGMALGAFRAASGGDRSRARSLRIGQGAALFVFAAVALLTAWLSLGNASIEAEPGVMMGALSMIFLGLGAFLGRIGPNPMIGVRTPWSYKSRRAWDRSNRLAGRLFFLVGLAGVIAAPLSPQPLGTSVMIAAVLIVAALSVFESRRVWRADPDRQPF